jgi:4-hydroxy-3-polyprenylbenzoate decarboxylase
MLRRVACEVDPYLEAPEIAMRVVREGGPALLFTKVKGSSCLLLMNLFGTYERIEVALGRLPQEIGEEIARLMTHAMERGAGALFSSWSMVKKIAAAKVSEVPYRAPSPVPEPDLGVLPVTTSWPQDGGPFFTFPLVITADPVTRRRNMGIYRMQVFDGRTTGMHWQIEKGGRFHFTAACAGAPMPVSVAVGADPYCLLSAVLPLPEGVDELSFAGFLRGAPTQIVGGTAGVPASAEIVLHGEVNPDERRDEGPFGDHYGHYSGVAPFPVFRLKSLAMRPNAIFHATVVGKPPMEDWHLGVMTVEMLKPLVRLIHPEISDLWAFPEAGFHNLQAVAVRERYGRESLKSALFLLGTGQTSLAKVVVVVGPAVKVKSFEDVIGAIGRCFDLSQDLILLAPTSTDTLDFAGPSLEKGSKIILIATTPREPFGVPAPEAEAVRSRFLGIRACRIIADTLLVVKGVARDELPEILAWEGLGPVKIVASVSGDVDLDDPNSIAWGIFTRFDPARDLIAERIEVRGLRAVPSGRLGIDAVLKEGYPEPLEMEPRIREQVDRRWSEYFSI